MILIVGLGNPGKEYQNTRHNLGFMVVDELAKKWGVEWAKNKKIEIELGIFTREDPSGRDNPSKNYLLKPMTFMNKSGEAVRKFLEFYKLVSRIHPSTTLRTGNSELRIFLIHDDVDLDFGRLKIQLGGSTAGHKGVESVKSQILWDQVVRFRCGIGRPKDELKTGNLKLITGTDWVLSKFTSEEQELVRKTIERAAEAIEVALQVGVISAMNSFN